MRPISFIFASACLLLAGLLSACSSAAAAQVPEATATYTASPTPPPPTATLTPAPTATPTPIPTLEPVWSEPGSAVAPILLYHHIAPPADDPTYYVAPDAFRRQMEWLYTHGYQTISVARLARALEQGELLPARPVILTFDDGDVSVYQTAFPILNEYGFTASVYLIASQMDGQTYMNAEQLGQLVKAGWEIGSHSMTHQDVTRSERLHWNEICRSREVLQQKLGVPVDTFAYPYGKINATAMSAVKNCGYTSAVGLGGDWEHASRRLYNLQRIEIRYNLSLENFPALLPWR